jgi:transposase-like protein
MSREPNLEKRASWRLRLREFDRGNATVAEFCRRGGVSVAAFYQWRRKLRPSAAPDASAASRGRAVKSLSFLPVEITGGASIEVLLASGARVTVPCHDQEAIRTVMAALLSASPVHSRPEDPAC